MHPRNRHTGRYDFDQLTKISPELAQFVSMSPRAELTIDFASAEAVKALNRALLKQFYGISKWDIPPGYLCPPIPGRADYLHTIADLLGSSNLRVIPRGGLVRVLDIGTGANCIYPIIGLSEYGWSFVGSDVDPIALASAQKIVQKNKGLMSTVELRLQPKQSHIFKGIFHPHELFDTSICNPPFHASLVEAQEGSKRKWNNLGIQSPSKKNAPQLNFGGQGAELFYPGGETEFARRMIEESAELAESVFWFSILISKSAHLDEVYAELKRARVKDYRTLEMAQGQKKSRVIAWTFLSSQQQEEWREKRWLRSSL